MSEATPTNNDDKSVSFSLKTASDWHPVERVHPLISQEEISRRTARFGPVMTPTAEELEQQLAPMKSYALENYKNPDKSVMAKTLNLTSKEEQEKKKHRAQRFGVANETISTETETSLENAKNEESETSTLVMDPLEARLDIPASYPRRYTALHLYGTDVLTTHDVLHYFRDYHPSHIEWINDSSCNIVFDTAQEANDAWIAKTDQIATLQYPEGMEDVFKWRVGVPTPEFVGWRPLIRLATYLDVKKRGAKEVSVFYKVFGKEAGLIKKKRALREPEQTGPERRKTRTRAMPYVTEDEERRRSERASRFQQSNS